MKLPDFHRAGLHVRHRIICRDGTSVSVQASRLHYCEPRTDEGPWTHYEVGFPEDASGEPIKFPPYWDEYNDSSGVCGYVPAAVVEQFIADHGGQALPTP